MKITISLPPAFEKRLKKMLRRLENPESEIEGFLAEFATTGNLATDESLWTDSFVYPDRDAAHRVATRLLADDPRRWTVELTYFSQGKEVSERFLAPALARSAEAFCKRKGCEPTPETMKDLVMALDLRTGRTDWAFRAA